MTGRTVAALRIVLVAMGAVGYDLLAHYSNLPATSNNLGAALSTLPPLMIAAGFAWRSTYRYAVLLFCALTVAVLIAFWPALQTHFAILYLMQQFGMWSALLFGFARSLRSGRVALCTHWADKMHGPLTAAELRYTRRVTQAWCVFFAVMALTGSLLFILAPRSLWSAFNNLWTLPLLGVMFAGEYAVRLVALPSTRRRGIADIVRLYAASRR
jgi:uncharacterized membrane protein